MIEVLFGESEAGSMKAAKNTVIIGGGDGPTYVWMAGKKGMPSREKTKEKTKEGTRESAERRWIEGSAHEVICLGFMLDIGDIKESTESEYRKNLIYSMYVQGQWGRNEDEDRELKRAGEVYCKELERLRSYLEEGEPIRIWYSDAPYSKCGFYELCTILQKYKNRVRTVKLPEYRICSNGTVSRQSWGEIAAEEFAEFLIYEKELTREEINRNSILWKLLREDNSPLRAVVNGTLMGVPEDFYDFLIWNSLTKEPVSEARFIGSLLGKNQIGISDQWYARRIDFFITQGKIKIAADSENKYARMICLP